MLGDKPIRIESKVTLKDAEAGNSFIPRLWARMHLDKLLEQGSSEAIKQEIIALSEEYQIITPYTSFLVLESDADRERFAVKRRFQMRDGEKFFAEGRDNAAFELKQQQMKRAGDYRTALRRKVLAQLMTLGRDVRLFQRPSPYGQPMGTLSSDFDGSVQLAGLRSGGPVGDVDGLGDFPVGLGLVRVLDDSESVHAGDWGEPAKKKLEDSKNENSPEGFEDRQKDSPRDGPDGSSPDPQAKEMGRQQNDERELALDDLGFGLEKDRKGRRPGEPSGEFESYGYAYGGRYQNSHRGSQLQWLGSLFPSLAPPAAEAKEIKSTWPAEALDLSRSLLRMDKLAKQKGGLVLVRKTDGYDSRRNELAARTKRLELVAPNGWLGRTTTDGYQVIVSWCDAKEAGSYSTAYLLGRVRGSNKIDLAHPPLELADESVTPLHVSYADYTPTIEAAGKDRALLILKTRDNPEHESRYLIDTSRHVLLSVEQRHKGKATATTKFDDFVEIAGSWWASARRDSRRQGPASFACDTDHHRVLGRRVRQADDGGTGGQGQGPVPPLAVAASGRGEGSRGGRQGDVRRSGRSNAALCRDTAMVPRPGTSPAVRASRRGQTGDALAQRLIPPRQSPARGVAQTSPRRSRRPGWRDGHRHAAPTTTSSRSTSSARPSRFCKRTKCSASRDSLEKIYQRSPGSPPGHEDLADAPCLAVSAGRISSTRR